MGRLRKSSDLLEGATVCANRVMMPEFNIDLWAGTGERR